MKSMHTRMPNVNAQKKTEDSEITSALFESSATFIIFSNNTFESSACARLRAQSLKYDAVFETVPRENSIVSIS